MNICKEALLFFPLPSPRPLPHRPHARPPRPFRHTAGEAGAPPPPHSRREAGAHPSSPPRRAGPPRSLSSTAHSSSLPCSVPCAEWRRGLAPSSSSSLSHDGDRIWLYFAARCHPPPPHPAPPRRMPPRCMWGPQPPPPAPAMLKDAEAGRAEQEAALCARDGEVARLMEQDPARAELGRSGPAVCARGGGPSRGCVGAELVARGEGGGGRPGARSWRLRRAGRRGGRRESGGAWRPPPRPRERGPRALSPRARGLRVPSRRRLPPWTAEGGQDPAAAMERRGRGAAAEAANSRGGGECGVREL